MYKNKYFKTTNGVPFELAMGLKPTQTITDQATINFKNFTAVINELYPVRIVPGSAERYIPMHATSAWNAGANCPANTSGHQIVFASCKLGGAVGTADYQNVTTPLLASSIRILKTQAAAAAVAQVSTLVLGGTFATGQIAYLKIIETTPGHQNLPSWEYEIPLTTGTTSANAVTDIAARLSALGIASSTVMSTTKADEWVYVTGASSTLTFTAAAGAVGRSFKVSFTMIPTKAAPTETSWTSAFTVTTKATWGYGTADHITNLIQEDAIRRSVGHYYPSQNATAVEFGTPDAGWTAIQAAVAGATPTLVTLSGVRSEVSPTPVEQHTERVTIHIYCSAAMATSLNVMFPA